MKSTAAAQLPDRLNPEFIFSMTDTDLLLQLASGQLDAQQLVREALAARGVDARGAWVGFTAAAKVWKTR